MPSNRSATIAQNPSPLPVFSLPFEPEHADVECRQTEKIRLLIADDDGVSRKLLERMLVGLGYEVQVAKTGTEALGIIILNPPQIVVSDWVMPGITGPELCRHVRERQASSYIYMVLLTAKTGRDDRLEALRAGADDFLTKPIDAAELQARLTTAKRILTMQNEIRAQRDELLTLRDELEQRNESMREAMDLTQVTSRRFYSLFQELPVPCITCDERSRVMEMNQASEQLYGYMHNDLLERSVFDVLCTDAERDRIEDAMKRCQNGERIRDLEWTNRCRDDREILVQSSLFPIEGASGEVVGVILASVDITDRRAYERALAEKATTDGLTGLKNHRHFRECLEIEFTAATKSGAPLSMLLLDVDHFKQYNDSFGHPAGDDVLRGVASTLAENAPPGALVARYGGEEFVVLAPGLGSAEICEVAEKLRKAIEDRAWPNRRVTGSFGCATLVSIASTPSELVDSADKALYESKRSGRNQVTHFGSLPVSAAA